MDYSYIIHIHSIPRTSDTFSGSLPPSSSPGEECSGGPDPGDPGDPATPREAPETWRPDLAMELADATVIYSYGLIQWNSKLTYVTFLLYTIFYYHMEQLWL